MYPVKNFWLFTQKHSILDVWRGSEYACVQIAPGNDIFHHSKHLMEYFEFLRGSRIICLPSNISDKLHWQYVFGKLKKGRDSSLSFLLIWYSTHTPRYHIIFSSWYQSCKCSRSGPFCWRNPCSASNSGIVYSRSIQVYSSIQEVFKCIQEQLPNVVVFEYTFFQLCPKTEKIS